MMKYLKIAYNMFTKKLLFNIILIIEIAVLLVLSNIIVATYNSKYMLYKPYEEILNGDGVVIELDTMPETDGYDIWINGVDEVYKNLEGDVRVITTDLAQPMATDVGISSNMYYDFGYVSDYILLEEDILEKLRLPLAQGRWCSSELNEKGQIEVVVSSGTNAKIDDVYHLDFGDIVVVGILTDTTYKPNISRGIIGSASPKGVFAYYEDFDCNISMETGFVILNKNLVADEDLENWNKGPTMVLMVSYGSDVTDEMKAKNIEYLKTLGEVGFTFSETKEATMGELNGIFIKMLPVIIAVIIVVLSGLTGSVAISTMKQIKNFGIFFLCGCRWKDCFKIISANVLIIFILSGVLTIGGIICMNMLNVGSIIGLSFELNNLFISLGLIAFMFLMSIIMPYAVIKSTSPVETIKENAE